MEQWKLKLAAGMLILPLLLTGCGAKAEGSAAAGGQAASGDTAGGDAVQPPDRTADVMAKVVQVNAGSIVVQESTTPPSQMSGGGGFGGGMRGHRGQGQNGPNSSGQNERHNSQANGANEANGANGTDDGANGGNGYQSNGAASGSKAGRQGRGFGQMQFSDKQTTISINSDTEIVSMARGQQGMTMNRLQASDLKEGDIVTIWLDSDKKTAQYIMQRFNPANFRKAGNQG